MGAEEAGAAGDQCALEEMRLGGHRDTPSIGTKSSRPGLSQWQGRPGNAGASWDAPARTWGIFQLTKLRPRVRTRRPTQDKVEPPPAPWARVALGGRSG